MSLNNIGMPDYHTPYWNFRQSYPYTHVSVENLYLFIYFVSFSMSVGSDFMRIEKGLELWILVNQVVCYL